MNEVSQLDDKANILVVDDLPERLLVMQSVLEELDQNIITARSGKEALRQSLEHEFAVILLDVNMPDMDGFEAAELIRSRKKSALTPIIFVTAYADEIQTTHGYSLGAVDYILAPVIPEILRTKVKVFVDLFRMNQQVKQQADERVALAKEQAARAAAEETTRRSTFLSEAGRLLGSSLNYDATLRSLTRLAVPLLADLAAATRFDDQARMHQTELAWQGPGEDVHTCILPTGKGLHPSLVQGIERAVSSGRTEIMTELGSWLPPAPDGLSTCNGCTGGLDLHSVVALPLLARGRTLGTLTLVRAASGGPHAGIDLALAEDMAGRAAIALDNARLYETIQQADRLKNDFLAMLAHELRNPLAPIRSAVQVIRLMGLEAPALIQARDIIDRQVTHMARLIDDLLDVSRISRGKILLRKERLDLVNLVRLVVEDHRSSTESADLTLEVQLPDKPLWIMGDAVRLAQVVGNVLHNAIKFTDAGGRIAIQVSRECETDTAQIIVRDTGIGMEPEMLERVFETFTQADRSLDRSRGGLGLGLALVKGLVALHGGSVRAVSEGLGKGTEFLIRLNLAGASLASGPSKESPALVNGSKSTYRILVIEDNKDTAESTRMLLTLLGHEVEVAFTGAEGVKAARDFTPEVVLSDIGVPGGMDGYAVARAFRQDPSLHSTYLVAVSGYGQEEDLRRSREAGFDQHLIKPVDFDQLENLLASLSQAAPV